MYVLWKPRAGDRRERERERYIYIYIYKYDDGVLRVLRPWMYRTCLGFRTQTCERIHHQSARLTVIDRYSKQTDISNHSLGLSTPRFRMQSSQARRMKESQLLLPKEGDSPQRHCMRQGAHQGEHHLKAHTHTHRQGFGFRGSGRGLGFYVFALHERKPQ